jgi:hypothetical protein
MSDGDIDRAIVRFEWPLPDHLEDRVTGKDPAGVGRQQCEDVHIARPHKDLAAAYDHKQLSGNDFGGPHDDPWLGRLRNCARQLKGDCSAIAACWREAISTTFVCMDEQPSGPCLLKRAAESEHAHIDRAVARLERFSPHVVVQRLATHNLAWSASQRYQKRERVAADDYRSPVHASELVVDIDFEWPDRQHLVLAGFHHDRALLSRWLAAWLCHRCKHP